MGCVADGAEPSATHFSISLKHLQAASLHVYCLLPRTTRPTTRA